MSEYVVCPSKYITNKKENVVYISDRMSGKMENIPAISSSCRVNPFCIARMKLGFAVCRECYAHATTGQYKDLEKRLEYNSAILSEMLIPLDKLPTFKTTVEIVRFEAFGDLINVTHARNYLRIARKNPSVRFALWTKNTNFIKQAIEMDGKPKNLNVIQSSLTVNKPDEIAGDYIDKRFTVYTAEYLEEHGTPSNCAGISCDSCRNCYLENNVAELLEILRKKGTSKKSK